MFFTQFMPSSRHSPVLVAEGDRVEKFETLRKSFDDYADRLPFDLLPVVRDEGLVLGYGTALARMGCNRRGEFSLVLHADEERLLALLSAVYGRQVSPRVMQHVWRASEQWRRGEKVLAQIELAFARFPRLETRDDAFRLFLAADLLANGMTPRGLMGELGFDPDLLKYDPEQRREPAGNGEQSGRWIRLGDGAGVSPALLAPAASAVGFLEGALPEALQGLAQLIGRVSVPTAVLGALLIPTNRSLIQEGELPGFPGVRYRFDLGMGVVTVTATSGDEKVAVGARRGPGGLLVDLQGRTLGRFLPSGIYLDADAVVDALIDEFGSDRTDRPSTETDKPSVETDKPGAESELVPHPDEPKLCPDPGPDHPHGSSKRALDYEEDVHERVNPELPLQRGQAVAVWNPIQGKYYHIDDCFRLHGDLVDGDMRPGDFADAKGPGYEQVFKISKGVKEHEMERLAGQAEFQIGAAGPRGAAIKWYFAEEYAADEVREKFSESDRYSKITIAYMPGRKRK
jgi:hypothetical protein